MGVPPGDARELSFWEYTALKAQWNLRHGGDSDPVELPPADRVRASLSRLNG